MKPKVRYKVIGLMSGTSLDGLDIACCEFTRGKVWDFRLQSALTFAYSPAWKRKLRSAHTLSGSALMELHAAYGKLMGAFCNRFIKLQRISGLDAVASHGHTIFHQPGNSFTFQLGDGASLHAVTGLPVVSNFRALDVALGGEGAPLVPVGDRLLFSNYDACLNLGGIANISMDIKGQRKAFDIAFCNMSLNYLMHQVNKAFDHGGKTAASGKINQALLKAFSQRYAEYRLKRPSLAREMFEVSFQPLLDNKKITLADRLRTVCESVAIEIEAAVPRSRPLRLLATGGGALNTFLVNLLKEKLMGKAELILPPRSVIEFKEAIIFAFLGVLRLRNEMNVLRSVTHARRDSSSGSLVGR